MQYVPMAVSSTYFVLSIDRLIAIKKHPLNKLHPSEVVTIGLLLVLKGWSYRAFYRWFRPLSASVPRFTRSVAAAPHLMNTHVYTDQFLADPTILGIIDSFGIELLHTRREGRRSTSGGKKGISNHRWIVGIKLAWLINQRREVVEWSWFPANVSDQEFRDVVAWWEGTTIALGDRGFQVGAAENDGVPIKICGRADWNFRFLIDTAFSLLERVFQLMKLEHRTARGMDMHLVLIA